MNKDDNNRGRTTIVTVFGVGHAADWEADIRATFGSIFPIHHASHTCIRNVLVAVLTVGALPIAVVFSLVSMCIFRSLLVSAVSLALCLFALIASRGYKARAVNQASKSLSKLTTFKSPHVLCYSFGTYIFARWLETTELLWSRVGFLASMIPADFDWSPHRVKRVKSVNCYVGSNDWVARYIFALLSYFDRDFGPSGWKGFSGPLDLVHVLDSGETNCTNGAVNLECKAVHNIPTRTTHWQVLVDVGFLERHLMPYFLGFSNREFMKYMDLCLECHEEYRQLLDYMDAGDFRIAPPSRLRSLEDEFLKAKWSWFGSGYGGGVTMSENIIQCLRLKGVDATHRMYGDIINSVPVRMWAQLNQSVLRLAERRRNKEFEFEPLATQLDPRTAIATAVKSVVGEYGSLGS